MNRRMALKQHVIGQPPRPISQILAHSTKQEVLPLFE